MKIKLIFLSFLLCFTCAHPKKITPTSSWEKLKSSAHQIGFCVYHINMPRCTEHDGEYERLRAITPEYEEVDYFEMKATWAKQRIKTWAERQKMPSDQYLILFDINQGNRWEEKKSNGIINRYGGFSIFNLKNEISFQSKQKSEKELTCSIHSDVKDSILENFHWREFMTHRLGRLGNKIEFELEGENVKILFEIFEKEFLAFQKNNT
ncbi:MAG: hypothetical protein AAF573_07880 [Bacteroidota bacterium]